MTDLTQTCANSASARVSEVLALAADFRLDDFLAFHRRDPQRLAERVGVSGLEKGLLWAGQPACLSLRFEPGRVVAELVVEGDAGAGGPDSLASMVRRMLGLNQPIAKFEAACATHGLIGPLIAARPGLRVPASATPFEALSWAIIGQQISVGAAVSMRRKLIQMAGVRLANGLACFPDAAAILGQGENALRQAGLSGTKAATLMTLSAQVMTGDLPLDEWLESPEPTLIRERLLGIRGIGPWTVNYALLRGFACVDGSLHGDVAVRRALQRLLGRPEKISEVAAQTWLAEFSPWRALVAAHLWASGGVVA